jgi:hypothetical protein
VVWVSVAVEVSVIMARPLGRAGFHPEPCPGKGTREERGELEGKGKRARGLGMPVVVHKKEGI